MITKSIVVQLIDLRTLFELNTMYTGLSAYECLGVPESVLKCNKQTVELVRASVDGIIRVQRRRELYTYVLILYWVLIML